jgi:hypothetical protein
LRGLGWVGLVWSGLGWSGLVWAGYGEVKKRMGFSLS